MTTEELIRVFAKCKNAYPYKSWKEPKKSGNGFRLIETPNGILYLVQKRLNALLQRLVLPSIFHGCYKGTHIKSNAEPHKGRDQYEAFDLSNYYFNLRYKKVYQAFLQLDCSPDISGLLTRLTTIRGHVPQGAPTSPIIAVLCLLSAAKRIWKLCKEIGAEVTIYGDNVSISGPIHIHRYTDTIEKILRQESFKIRSGNDKRLSMERGRPWPLPGLELHRNEIDIQEKDFTQVKDLLVRCHTIGRQALKKMTCQRFATRVRGLVHHFVWVGKSNDSLTERAHHLKTLLARIQWPEANDKSPCATNKCWCRLDGSPTLEEGLR